MEFKIKKELIEKILNYLFHKPYGEVHTLIAEIQQIEAIEDLPSDEKEQDNRG